MEDTMKQTAGRREAPATPVGEREELSTLISKPRAKVSGTQGQERLIEARDAIARAKTLRRTALSQIADVHDVFGDVKERLRRERPGYRA
jgi:hypothetical protein